MTKVFESRRYQEKAVENFKDWYFNSDEKLATILLATGSGKSRCAALCINELYGKKVIWLAHRLELVEQGYDTLKEVIKDNRKISLEIGDKKGDPNSDIVVGSVQTIARTRKHFDEFVPDFIFIDEYHHYSENNKQYDGLLKKWPKARILGATATAFRSSGEELPLGRILIQMDIGVAVEKGYLVKPIARSLISDVSLADVKKSMGDFQIGPLAQAINVDSRNSLIVDAVIKLIKEEGRQGIIFAADKDHSKALYEMLKNHVRVGQVYGDTPIEERKELMRKIRNQEIDVLTNLSVCTEGFDAPHLSFVCMARPTSLLGLYLQCCGRALRKFSGKTDCIILDVYDKIKHKQSRVTFADMAIAGDLSGDKKRAKNVLESKVPLEDEISQTLKNFPIFIKTDKTRWTADEDTFSVSSWAISQDQWLVTWSAEIKEPKSVVTTQWVNWDQENIDAYPMQGRSVRHPVFGQGNLKKIKDKKATCIFGKEEKLFQISSLEIQKYVKTLSDTEFDTKKIERLYYICLPEIKEDGRVISFIRDKKNLILQEDQRMPKASVNLYLQGEALKDEVYHLVRTNAKWKSTPASDKQKEFVQTLLKNSKVDFDIDLNNLTKGEAGSIIEQGKWQEIINQRFGTTSKEKLLGFDISSNDL